MRIPKSRKTFVGIIIMIILLPLSSDWKLFMFGEMTQGEVIRQGINPIARGGYYHVSIIKFQVGSEVYQISSPNNVQFEIGEKINILFEKDNPSYYAILNLWYFYTGLNVILPGILLIFWLAFYHTFAENISRKKSISNKIDDH